GWIAADLLALVAQPVELLQELVERGVGVDAVGETGGSADGGLRSPADEYRYGSGWLGPHRQFGQGIDPALVAERLTGPRLGQDLQDLLHRPSPTGDVGSERLELDVQPPQSEAEGEPAV